MALQQLAQYAAMGSFGIAFLKFVLDNWRTIKGMTNFDPYIVPILLVLGIVFLVFSMVYPKYHPYKSISQEAKKQIAKSAKVPVLSKKFESGPDYDWL